MRFRGMLLLRGRGPRRGPGDVVDGRARARHARRRERLAVVPVRRVVGHAPTRGVARDGRRHRALVLSVFVRERGARRRPRVERRAAQRRRRGVPARPAAAARAARGHRGLGAQVVALAPRADRSQRALEVLVVATRREVDEALLVVDGTREPARLQVLLHLALHRAVPVVLDRVVRAAGQLAGDLGPLVADLDVLGENRAVLVLGPRLLGDVRVEVVVPPLAALLADAPRQVRRDLRPLLGPVLRHELDHLLVLVLAPGALDRALVLGGPALAMSGRRRGGHVEVGGFAKRNRF
mmetsp:Transcript_17726/g.71156  ORF Transcript_17726/g.71156 Transcript_17726/m.71156 type:complete len:295 (+) Transcript_17726:723-1607(+)